jgi:Leucine-rich repeat (LRR) protein
MISAQTTAIPDPNFELYLETHDAEGNQVEVGDPNSMGDGIQGNSQVTTARLITVLSLDVSGLDISDLTGIQDFTDLETLICSNNDLTNLDLSNNLKLISLLCGSNKLRSLDVSANTNLESLNATDNQITNLNLSNNENLESVSLSKNQIANLDLSNNPNLVLLSASDNRLVGALDLSSNANLQTLFCASNQITAVDLSANPLLRQVDLSDNVISSLDLTSINTVSCPEPQTDPLTPCQDLSTINVSRNQLISLVVNNGFNDLIAFFNASGNPDLFCIQIDSGFTPEGWIKDDWTYFSEESCVDIFTYIPDDNFEQQLINLGLDDVLDNLVLTSNIANLINLDVSNANIESLEGIQDFLSLEVLYCSNNNLQTIDLSSNSVLTELHISNNAIEALNLSANSNLETLFCANNVIENLDLSSNTSLEFLNCANNLLTGLLLGTIQTLNEIDVSFNQVAVLDLTSNTALTSVLIHNNNLLALNLANGNNTSITVFNALGNPDLFCIEVDDVAFANGATGWQKDGAANYNLNCGTYVPDDAFEQALINQGIDSDGTLNNYVPTADVSGVINLNLSGLTIEDLTGIQDFTALQTLDCSNNALEFLVLNANLALESLNCSNNQISTLDLTANNSLSSIFCQNNTLLSLNIANGFNSNITAFNAQNNPTLSCITVDASIVNNIPGAWQKDNFATYNDDCLNNRFTSIPDPFFEQALIDLGYDNVIDGQVLTSTIEIVEILEISGKSISDLSGIKDFYLLKQLDCSSNFLESLDVSNMRFLESLNCGSNFLLTNDINSTNGLLNISGTVALKELFCAGNNLTDLATSANTSLEVLDCADNRLITLDISNNNLLKRLNCSNNDIGNLDISNALVLETLNCDSNALTSLVVASSANNSLITLSCTDNQLETLDVSNYQALSSLLCSSNNITELDTSSNFALEYLSADNNQIAVLNLANNTVLKELLISQNNLSQLQLSTNTTLRRLNCSFNEIELLNLASNPNIEQLYATNNLLTQLDLSVNENLKDIDIRDNQISNLVLANDLSLLKRLNASNNQIEGGIDLTSFAVNACDFIPGGADFCPESITVNLSGNQLDFINIQNGINDVVSEFNASNNPVLDCIQVDDENAINPNWIKDESTNYAEECNFGETFVPDDNFEQALIALGLDTGVLDDFVPTANIESLLSLDLSNNSISDLTGIEDFIALESLNVSNNNLNFIDLSGNLNLMNLSCADNELVELDLHANSALMTLDCSNNLMTDLDLTNNTQINQLNLANNILILLELSELQALQNLNVDFNSIVDLDLSANSALNSVSCEANELETLNLKNGQNALLNTVNARNNPNLNCIETDSGAIPSGADWLFDDGVALATECFFGQTFIPDDNFEQSLINLGYDSGELDDYVPTENILSIEFLDLSNQQINDLTGIEDFIGLTVLNVENNNLNTIQLNALTDLIDLNLSNNALSNIDLSALVLLKKFNASNNQLTTIELSSNTVLVDLNLSNNQITELQLSFLTELESLSCASNQLTELEVVNNMSLKQLFCQSNQLVADRLNLQNGNNQALEVLNAINNPDLRCILVDDPVAVISNVEGLYDNWLKDATANYQSICEDADNDGIANEEDQCPNTPFGALVDLFGCAIPNLPFDNFSISVTSETCLNANNGIIRIEAQELHNYIVTLSNDNFNRSYNFTDDIDIFNLLAGTYQLCISMEEWPSFQSCFTIVISQPDPLEVFTSVVSRGEELSVHLTGATTYFISFNNEDFIVNQPSFTLELQPGSNHLTVKTGLDCQGVFNETIWRSETVTIFPNPFDNLLTIANLSADPVLELQMYTVVGSLVFSASYGGRDSDITIDTSGLDSGVYILSIKSRHQTVTHKIVKQ